MEDTKPRKRRFIRKTKVEKTVDAIVNNKTKQQEGIDNEIAVEALPAQPSILPSIATIEDETRITHRSKSATKTIPSTENHYIYKLPSILSKDDIELEDGRKIFVSLYSIRMNGMLPFLTYLLYKMPYIKDEDDTKNRQKEVLFFPYTKFNSKKSNSLFNQSNQLCDTILSELQKQQQTEDTYIYERTGYLDRPEGVYVFYRVTNAEENATMYSRNNLYWWVLIDEIVNVKSCVNFPIFEPITYIFSQYKHITYIYQKHTNSSGENYETIVEVPTSAYHGTHISFLPKIASLGLNPSTFYSMMGSYYYFGTYRKAVRYAGWTSTYKPREVDGVILGDSEGRYDQGGIIRFAIFLGKMRVFLNHPDEPDDYSDLVKERMADPTHNKRWETNTLKLHDHTGKWAEHFDSVYIGKAKLVNGKNFMSNPEYVVKVFEQQTPLSYHTLDMTTLKKNWDNNYEYYYIE